MATNGMVEFRWHGRGGQGAKMACLLLADVAGSEGKFVQGFPEYGPERMGAPITAYNRISEKRCTIHSNIYYPDYVVVVDESLLDSVDVTGGLKEDGAIIINTPSSPQEMRVKLLGWAGRICTIDARRISEENLGRNIPNTPMLAAAVKVSGVLETGRFLACIEESLKHKFAAKPEVIEGNMLTLKKSLEEVRVG
ncbi:MAG: pyruvate synthase [Syntrophomonadaceae bacterium]|nr:pyruvate synthase [Syntrophomonadaceae bacterium]